MKAKKIITFLSTLFIICSGIFAQKVANTSLIDVKKSQDLNRTKESNQFMDSTIIKIPLGQGNRLEDIKAFDTNYDGTDELIILKYNGVGVHQILVYQWINDQFVLKWDSGQYGGYPYGMQIKDIDLDGKADMLVSLGGLKYFQNVDSLFVYKGELINWSVDDIFLAGDLNNDNYPDLALGSVYSGDYPVYLYQQNSVDTSFIYVGILPSTYGNNMVKGLYSNLDTSIDILTGELYSGDIYVYKNNGNFNFENIYDTTFNTRIFSIETEDFDNDNFEDFVIAEAWAKVHFFKNTGTDSFEVKYSGSMIGSAFQSVANDIDKDGYSDLLVGAFDGNVYLYHNLGEFNFNEIHFPLSANSNYGLAVGDFNNDAKSDIAFGKDTVFIALNAVDIFGITSINDESIVEIPKQHELYQNFPNPFNPNTTISYAIHKFGNVRLKIYDIQGRVVQTLVNKFQKPNVYTINFDATKFSSGIYFYNLQVGNDFTEINKMMFIK